MAQLWHRIAEPESGPCFFIFKVEVVKTVWGVPVSLDRGRHGSRFQEILSFCVKRGDLSEAST